LRRQQTERGRGGPLAGRRDLEESVSATSAGDIVSQHLWSDN